MTILVAQRGVRTVVAEKSNQRVFGHAQIFELPFVGYFIAEKFGQLLPNGFSE